MARDLQSPGSSPSGPTPTGSAGKAATIPRADGGFHCPHCDRVLGDANGLYCHVKIKHGRKAARPFRPVKEQEPSMAELVVEAQINRALGLPVEAWIAEIFDV